MFEDSATSEFPSASARELHALPSVSAADSIDGRHLRYFLAVAETGSVTAAAVLLHVSQPSLSQQIIWLEKQVGRKLFRRDGRGMHLTKAGRAFRDGVQDIPIRLREAIGMAEFVSGRQRITLAVCSCIDYAVVEDAVGALNTIIDRRSGSGSAMMSEIVLQSAPSYAQVAALKQGQLDLGVLRPPSDDDDLETFQLSDEPFHVVLHRDHEMASRRTLRWDELVDYPLIWALHLDSPHLSSQVLRRVKDVTPRRRFVWAPDNHPAVLGHLFRTEPSAIMLCSSPMLDGLPHLVHRTVQMVPYRDPIALATRRDGQYASLVEQLRLRRSGPKQRGGPGLGDVGEEPVVHQPGLRPVPPV